MMKIFVFLAEILCFGRRRNKRERNVDGRNIHKFRQKLEKFGDFFKKLPLVGKFRRKNVLFRFISANFRRFFEKRFVPLTPGSERTR